MKLWVGIGSRETELLSGDGASPWGGDEEERKKEQENGAGQKGEKQGREGAMGARAAAETVPGSPPWVPPFSCALV